MSKKPWAGLTAEAVEWNRRLNRIVRRLVDAEYELPPSPALDAIREDLVRLQLRVEGKKIHPPKSPA